MNWSLPWLTVVSTIILTFLIQETYSQWWIPKSIRDKWSKAKQEAEAMKKVDKNTLKQIKDSKFNEIDPNKQDWVAKKLRGIPGIGSKIPETKHEKQKKEDERKKKEEAKCHSWSCHALEWLKSLFLGEDEEQRIEDQRRKEAKRKEKEAMFAGIAGFKANLGSTFKKWSWFKKKGGDDKIGKSGLDDDSTTNYPSKQPQQTTEKPDLGGHASSETTKSSATARSTTQSTNQTTATPKPSVKSGKSAYPTERRKNETKLPTTLSDLQTDVYNKTTTQYEAAAFSAKEILATTSSLLTNEEDQQLLKKKEQVKAEFDAAMKIFKQDASKHKRKKSHDSTESIILVTQYVTQDMVQTMMVTSYPPIENPVSTVTNQGTNESRTTIPKSNITEPGEEDGYYEYDVETEESDQNVTNEKSENIETRSELTSGQSMSMSSGSQQSMQMQSPMKVTMSAKGVTAPHTRKVRKEATHTSSVRQRTSNNSTATLSQK